MKGAATKFIHLWDYAEELMAERGLAVDHTLIWRWIQVYGPEMSRQLHGALLLGPWIESVRTEDANV
jgi:hypothetical protein